MCNSSAMQSIKSSSVVKHLSSSINRNQSRGQGRENITNRSSFYSTMPCAIRERLAHFIHNTLSHWFSRERRTKKKKREKNWGRVMNEQERGCDWSVLKTCAALNVWKVNLGKELWCPPWWSGSPKAQTQRRVSRNIASTRVWWMSQHRRKPIAELRDWGTEILTKWAGYNLVIFRNTD